MTSNNLKNKSKTQNKTNPKNLLVGRSTFSEKIEVKVTLR
jgi:hypothetical protein